MRKNAFSFTLGELTGCSAPQIHSWILRGHTYKGGEVVGGEWREWEGEKKRKKKRGRGNELVGQY